MHKLTATLAAIALLVSTESRAQELNAIYASQTAFEMRSPIIYTTTGLCIESAVKLRGKIQVFLPPLQDVLEWGFMALSRNLEYVIDFPDDRPAFASLPTGFSIDMAGVEEEEFRQGILYNVTVADVSAGVQFDLAKASCHFKLGYA